MKKSPRLPRGLAILILSGIVPLVSSCNSTPASASAARADTAKIVTQDYEYVKVTGSHIPIKVPTSPTARALPTSLPIQTISGDAFRDAMSRGGVPIR